MMLSGSDFRKDVSAEMELDALILGDGSSSRDLQLKKLAISLGLLTNSNSLWPKTGLGELESQTEEQPPDGPVVGGPHNVERTYLHWPQDATTLDKIIGGFVALFALYLLAQLIRWAL